MNILCLGARVIGLEVAKDLVAAFLAARFTGEERHLRRLEKVRALEEKATRGKMATDEGSRGKRQP